VLGQSLVHVGEDHYIQPTTHCKIRFVHAAVFLVLESLDSRPEWRALLCCISFTIATYQAMLAVSENDRRFPW
jgi:hypothetical protein